MSGSEGDRTGGGPQFPAPEEGPPPQPDRPDGATQENTREGSQNKTTQHQAPQIPETGPLGFLYQTLREDEQEGGLEEMLRSFESRATGGARKKDTVKKGRNPKYHLHNLHPFALTSKLTSRAWGKSCQDRKLTYNNRENAARLFYFRIVLGKLEEILYHAIFE